MSARRNFRHWVVAPLAILLMSSAVVGSVSGADTITGSQGTDTSLPPTDSAVTVSGRGKYDQLKITVNQTRNLTNQAVSITWQGGEPTKAGPGRFGMNYLQIFQCWGDDDGRVPENPGPPPEQCVQGAATGAPGIGSPSFPGGIASTRIISREGWENFDLANGARDPANGNLWLPFRSVVGVEVPFQVNSAFREGQTADYWLNSYFGIATTNEVVGAVTGANGTGAELMQVVTGLQSSGLGCGQTVEPVAGGGKKVPECWIVVVPRGTPADENVGTPFTVSGDQAGVVTSPVAPEAWKNRIAVPIEFNSVDTACSLGVEERRISGNELVGGALSSWQPLLCGQQKLPPFSYGVVGDSLARQQLATAAVGSAGMVVVSRPLGPQASTPSNPVVYAPLTLSGLAIGVNVERIPRLSAPDDAQQLAGVRVADINLTPRLVAKLLTQSYTAQVSIFDPPDYKWLSLNATHLANDPDFLQFNPEFEQLEIGNPRNFSGLALPAGNSDAALQVWEWIFADPEAKRWLDGAPDEWGMVVNPVYAAAAERNPASAAFGTPLPSSFPKGDPYCYRAPARGPGNSIVPPAVCGTDWMPYARGFADAAVIARRAFDGARIVDNPNAISESEVWRRDTPQTVGRRSMLALTDTSSAAQFGLQTARLSRAGDNGSDRQFVKPDVSGLRNGVATMAAKSVPGFLEPAPAGRVAVSSLDASAQAQTVADPGSGAYPLTVLTYAAIKPLALGGQARSDYAGFVDFAVTSGQQPGLEPGRLPRGYVPLPAELAAQATAAASDIRTMQAPPSVTPPAIEGAPSDTMPETSSPQTSSPQTSSPQTSSPQTSSPQTSSPASRTRSTARPVTAEVPASEVLPDAEIPVEEPVQSDTAVTPGNEPEVAPAKASAVTPLLALGRSRYAVASLGVVSLMSLLGALEISKRPRRAGGSGPSASGAGGVSS